MALTGKLLKWGLACIAVLAMMSCEDTEETYMDNLTDGYWLPVSGTPGYMMQYRESGILFYYDYKATGRGYYDACVVVDENVASDYAIDIQNSRICILPDEWYDVLVLNARNLTLSNTEGVNYKYLDVEEDDVTVMSADQFYRKYPRN